MVYVATLILETDERNMRCRSTIASPALSCRSTGTRLPNRSPISCALYVCGYDASSVTAAIWLTVRTHIGVACMVHIMGSVYSYLRRVPAMERTCFSLRSPKH